MSLFVQLMSLNADGDIRSSAPLNRFPVWADVSPQPLKLINHVALAATPTARLLWRSHLTIRGADLRFYQTTSRRIRALFIGNCCVVHSSAYSVSLRSVNLIHLSALTPSLQPHRKCGEASLAPRFTDKHKQAPNHHRALQVPRTISAYM
jgi:hypothetical protein